LADAAAFFRPLTGDTRVPPGNKINFASPGVIFDTDGPKLGPFCVAKKQNLHPRWGKTRVCRFGSKHKCLLVLQNPNKTPQICVKASFTMFTGVVESLFLVVKSCVLAGEKQWFAVLVPNKNGF